MTYMYFDKQSEHRKQDKRSEDRDNFKLMKFQGKNYFQQYH